MKCVKCGVPAAGTVGGQWVCLFHLWAEIDNLKKKG